MRPRAVLGPRCGANNRRIRQKRRRGVVLVAGEASSPSSRVASCNRLWKSLPCRTHLTLCLEVLNREVVAR